MKKTCNSCNLSKDVAELRDMPPIPFAAHEAEVSRQERQIKRMWIALIVLVVALFLTNMAWIGVFNSYEYSTEEIVVEQDAQDGGNNNYIGNNGDINNGLSENNNTQEEEN